MDRVNEIKEVLNEIEQIQIILE